MQILQLISLALATLGDYTARLTLPNSEVQSAWGPPKNFSRPPAIVLWHGLGDNYNSTGMRRMAQILNQMLPDVYVHSVYLDENPQTDERRSLLGDANIEVDLVCEQLSTVAELADGFGAIGFSQGGLFLRALIERCPNVTVSKLVTFGSPHMGVLELPLCEREDDWVCQRRNALLKRQVWNSPVQKLIVPAQYFRDLLQYANYLEHSNFLCEVNNERDEKYDAEAKARFEKLEKLVLIKFDRDKTLVPKESAHFQEVGVRGQVVPIEQTRLYKEDLIGLRKLLKEDKVDFYTIDDDHMRFSDQFFVDVVGRYFGDGL